LRERSALGSKIRRTGDTLRNTACAEINDYQQRFSKVGKFYELLFKDLIVEKFDLGEACQTARKLFGKDIASLVAIDGTEYSKPLFDMIIFYAGAYSCEGKIDFTGDCIARVKYKDRFMEKGEDVSSCVPVYLNKVPEIDQTFHDISQGRANIMKPMTEQFILDNTNVANFMMTFAEFYLAYKFAAVGNYDIILMDRSLSNMYSSLIYDTAIKRFWQTNCSILGFEIDGIPLDINDLTIARYNITNRALDLPPRRGDYLRYAILFNLLHGHATREEGVNFDAICSSLKLNTKDENTCKRIQNYLERSVEQRLIEASNGKYMVSKRYRSTWSRVKKLVSIIGDQMFHSDKQPFKIQKKSSDGKTTHKDTITTLDLAFLTLFSLYMLLEECWNKNILLIGITKDTTVHEFKNHVIPICVNNSIWPNNRLVPQDLDNIPNTDRMLLQAMSMLNYDKIHVPWSLIEYDAAFVTTIQDSKNRKGYVSGAIKNKIMPSQLFLRSFVQLEQGRQNSMLRSNVLAIDRLAYPSFDLQSPLSTVGFTHEYGDNELINFILYKNNRVKNEIQNLVIDVLKAMSSPTIPETFGHNEALYIADKIAKWHNEQFRKIVESTGTWILSDKGLRNFLLYMNSFRERREIFESSRKNRH